jgi:hypothetical protein
MKNNTHMGKEKKYSREKYLALVAASIKVGNIPFGRDAVLYWLGNYPGDLQAGLLYAEILLNENRHKQAIQVIRGLLKVDPEYALASSTMIEAIRTYEIIESNKKKTYKEKNQEFQELRSIAETNLLALGEEFSKDAEILPWGLPLYEARQSLKNGDLEEVAEGLHSLLTGEGVPSLAVVTYLQYIAKIDSKPVQSKLEIGEYYYQKMPDCLVVKLSLAHWFVESGKGDQAVVLLHEAAARDINGQVARRLWNENNPYQRVWPEKLELPINFPIPGDVASFLGWNQISPGSARVEVDEIDGFLATLNIDGPSNDLSSQDDFVFAASTTSAAAYAYHKSVDERDPVYIEPKHKRETKKLESEVAQDFRKEIERIAIKRKIPEVTKIDGRFPIYVVFSMRCKLVEKYGEKKTQKIESEMDRLVEAVQSYHRWGALRFFGDICDLEVQEEIPSVKSNDPWNLKLAITDLDAALAKRGQMIGALLIVGGPEIVPYHNLPNPVDDQDDEVPSDNPYGTHDENYFVLEWPVGRLPGGIESDGVVLLNQLRRIADNHTNNTKKIYNKAKWLRKFAGWIGSILNTRKESYGYTAAVWKKASYKVYQPIGKPKSMFVSPPIGFNEVEVIGDKKQRKNGRYKSFKLPKSRLGYFNLHGLIDAAEWYGQNDALDPLEGPNYPIALRPKDIGLNGRKKPKKPPEIVFSEACYGAYITGKSVNEAISLQFLNAGSRVVVGSTCMSYGSISPPLIAADLLGFLFWNYVCEGLPAGEALKQAKISLAHEMNQRQGYLDGEDQKTLISFILFGDPLDKPFNDWAGPKSIERLIEMDEIETICDSTLETKELYPIPDEVMLNVKQVVEKYLPGMKNPDVMYCHECNQRSGDSTSCPTSQKIKTKDIKRNSHRRLITLSKTITKTNNNHPNYARLTMNAEGKLIKLAVSR